MKGEASSHSWQALWVWEADFSLYYVKITIEETFESWEDVSTPGSGFMAGRGAQVASFPEDVEALIAIKAAQKPLTFP